LRRKASRSCPWRELGCEAQGLLDLGIAQGLGQAGELPRQFFDLAGRVIGAPAMAHAEIKELAQDIHLEIDGFPRDLAQTSILPGLDGVLAQGTQIA
jgi:hypothetical protein